MSKSIISLLVVGVALLAILLVGCSDEPSPLSLHEYLIAVRPE